MVDTMAAGDSLLTAFLVSYVSKEKEGHGGPQAIRESLDLAAGFAANTCGLAGSWELCIRDRGTSGKACAPHRSSLPSRLPLW